MAVTDPPPQKCYLVRFSSNVGDSVEHICMEERRLEKLLAAVPVLRNHWFGHPNMKPKELEKNTEGTMQILEIDPHLKVSKKSFQLLMQCALGLENIPKHNSNEWKDLMDTLDVLGGSEMLEQRMEEEMQRMEEARRAPLPVTPEEDTMGIFTWMMLLQNDADFAVKQQNVERMGYSYTKTFQFAPHITQVYYRKASGRA